MPGKGAVKVMELPVSAPFHSALMAPAAECLQPELSKITFSDMQVPVISNVEAKPFGSRVRVPKLLSRSSHRARALAGVGADFDAPGSGSRRRGWTGKSTLGAHAAYRSQRQSD